MNDQKREKRKKHLFFILSLLSAFVFIAGIMMSIMGDASPVKFIVNESPIKSIVPPMLLFVVTFSLYKKSKKRLEEKTKKKQSC